MIRCRPNHLESRAIERGYTFDEVAPCIVERHDNGEITVDPDHPAYPHAKPGLGDRVADGLAAVGITKERVRKVLGRDCGCKKRQELLNKIGQKVVDFVRGNNGDKLDDKPH